MSTPRRPMSAPLAPLFFAALSALSLPLAGCGARGAEALDPPLADTLKQRITKARNAIEETRRAIARAQGTPYLAELKVRLGELLSDEARAHFQVARAREGVSDRPLHAPQVKTLKRKSIEAYLIALRDHPDSPLKARALFNMGQEHRELGEYDEMRAAFERLAQEAPDDPLTSEALLVLGGDAFDRGKLDEAAALLERVVQGPPHRVKGSAYYKLAWVRVNQDRCDAAIEGFEAAARVTQGWLDGPGREEALAGRYAELDVRRLALTDMAFCYGKERSEEGAVAHLRALSYDRPTFVAALERLSRRYAVLERMKGLRDTSRALLDVAPGGDRRLEDAQGLHTALKQLKDYSEVGADVERLCASLRRAATRPGLDAAARAQLVSEHERYARDLSVSALAALPAPPRAAVKGSGPQPPPSPALLEVARAHEAYLNTFKPGGFEGEGRLDLLSNLVEVYARLGMDFEAGRRAFERSLEVSDATERRDDAYEAVTRFQAALEGGDRGAADRVIARAALRRAAAELLRGQLSPEQLPRVRFAIAQSLYSEGLLEEATELLTAVAISHPGTEQGDTAALLALDAYQQSGDMLGLAAAGERLARLGVSDALRARLNAIVVAARQQQLDDLALEAAGLDGGDPTEELLGFAQSNANTPLGERALLNAFVAARGAADLPGMRRVADLIAAQYPQSEQLVGVWSSLARASAAQLDLDGALAAFDRAAERAPAQALPLRAASAELRAKSGDVEGALSALRPLLTPEVASTAEGRAALGLYATLVTQARPKEAAWSELSPFKEGAPPELSVALAYLQVLRGQRDEAEGLAQVAVSVDALPLELKAMGLYAFAEVYGENLREFKPASDVDELAEWVSLLELAEQSYLKVARLGDPLWGAAALSRLATLSRDAGALMSAFAAPPALVEPLKARGEALKRQSEQALKTCEELAWRRGLFTPPVRECLKGAPMMSAEVGREALAPRGSRAGGEVGAEERALVARNPQDFKAVTRLGAALLAANDPHLARLALAQGLQGGGPDLANLYGIACARVGDWSGALEGFGKAALGGLEAGVVNAQKALRQLGLTAAADRAPLEWPVSVKGGELW
jgi:tetratricopeptide (TPR) repeat protein